MPASASALRGRADGPELRAAIPRDGLELRKAIAAAISADKKRLGSDILMAIPETIGSVAVEAIPLSDLQAFVMEAP
jgi:3-dehydroquinate synthetase